LSNDHGSLISREGIWRNWGRDTFISLRGLLLLTGRFGEARRLILTYDSCLRHGLIPNLLAGPRYNARDAVWFWLYSISQYTQLVPNGHEILSENIQGKSRHSLIKTATNTHLNGLSFREYNAGYQLDRVMSDDGFNNKIGVDSKTGFVYGGNRWNCGTWMDKMGSSEQAGNKRHPGPPRDGSVVELVGLSRATIAWLIQMIENGSYPYQEQKTILEDWLKKIDQNFGSMKMIIKVILLIEEIFITIRLLQHFNGQIINSDRIFSLLLLPEVSIHSLHHFYFSILSGS
jgi:glycogen debranching enzyme